MTRRGVIIIVLVLVLLIAGGVGIYFLLQPTQLQGDAEIYDTYTLEIADNLFYDVRVVPNAVLESTDHQSIYSFDLLSIGVQDIEPTTHFKVQVNGRWVFAESKDNWLRPTVRGFEENVAYTGTYDLEHTDFEVELPEFPSGTNPEILEALAEGEAWLFGGKDFIRTGITYGLYDAVCATQLIRMTTLFKQDLPYVHKGERMWVERNDYVVAVIPVNYNTQFIIQAYGEQGRLYAAALVAGDFYA